jgi:hypothetical protein
MTATCPFIFVHIGSTYFPDHVVYAIKQARTFNPDAEIYFIAEGVHAEKVAGWPCQFVPLEDVPVSTKRREFNANSTLNREWRFGFWHYTTERLFVLEDFLAWRKIHESIHLENDNMIYFRLEHMLPILREEYKGLAAPYLGKGELTFGILYVKDLGALCNLNTFLLGMRHSKENEMKLGCHFFLENPSEADFLPVVSNECEVRENDLRMATAHGSAFRGVFDAAAYGQYMGGIDERNGDGLNLGFVNQTAAYPADQFKYEWTHFEGSLRFPTIHRHGNSWPIYVLHVHSKHLAEFTSY